MHRKEYYQSKKGRYYNLDQRTNVNNVQFERCDVMAENLPLSSEFRPAWDVSVLTKLGFNDIKILYTDSDDFTYDTSYGQMHTPVSFGLCARLPRSNVLINEEVYLDGLEKVQKYIDKGTEDIVRSWKVLSNKDCVKLLLVLYNVDLDASQAADILKCSYSLASHDLKLLKETGLVLSQKEDSRVIYYLSNRQAVRDLYLLTTEIKYDRAGSSGR
jgi:ArsR family transcriptional regulator